MKSSNIILTLLLPFIVVAQKEVKVQSKIQDVTVFTVGAQVDRTAKIDITKGINTFAFDDLSPALDEQSLQFKAGGDITVLSIKYNVDFEESTQAEIDKAAELNRQLKNLGEEVKTRQDLLAVSVNEEQVLMANTDFDVWEGMNVAQLQQGVDLVKNRLTEIKLRKRKLRNEIDDLNVSRQKVVNQIQEMRIEDARPQGVVVVKLKSEIAKTVEAQISYVVADAGWEPFYDLRVENVAKPLRIEYKGRVHQNTGEEWKDVNLTLSTGNPYEEGRLPQLDPWFLNFVGPGYFQQNRAPLRPETPGVTGTFQGLVIDNKTSEAIPFANVVALNEKGELIAGTTSGVDGKFRLEVRYPAKRLEISIIGYGSVSQPLDGTTRFFNIRLGEVSESLEEVVITYDKPLIHDNINIRGARSEGTVYYINGVKMRGNVNVPQAATQEAEVISGGRPAQYGDAIGGVYNERFSSQSGKPQVFQISQNQVNLKFEVDIPYDIPSDGEEYKVAIKEYDKEAEYLYRAIPKLNEHAFLTASMTDWEELNLMNGNAGIYYEGTYLGETYLNVEEAGDTLQVSLGRDENIVVLRNTVKQEEGSRFFSNKKEERFHYEIKVRNNKTAPLQLEITDQYPLSGNDEITVERVENSGGEVEDKTGIITWKFTLEPKEEKKLDLIYNVRYPAQKKVNLR